MKINKIILLLRVKNGILFIRKWLEVNSKLVDEIVVVDNGSTDGTLQTLKEHPKVVKIIRTEGFDEGRDLNLVYFEALKRNPDWCINLDVDELFEERVTYEKIHNLVNNRFISYIRFRRFHFYFDSFHFGADKHNFWELTRPSRIIWKPKDGLKFPTRKIHCASIAGLKGLFKISSYRIKHVCNLEIDYKLNAFDNYKKVDPDNAGFYNWHAKRITDRNIKLWKWVEFRKNPIKVLSTHYFLNFMLIFYMLLKKRINLTRQYSNKI